MARKRLKNIIYLCPEIAQAQGGIKVICRHAQLVDELQHLGVTGEVLFPHNVNFELKWFQSAFRQRRNLSFDPSSDLVIIPEIMVDRFAPQLRQIGVSYGIFVQNGYYVFNYTPNETARISAQRNNYLMARIILSISDNTTEMVSTVSPRARNNIVKVQYSIDEALFNQPEEKSKLITFMPRKMQHHSDLVARLLSLQALGDWRIAPIDGLNEQGVADLLRRSSIFMAFSELEGCPVPPLEAAFTGNRVIGYTGQGGLEYWAEPVFTEIQSGDVLGFVRAVLKEMARQDSGDLPAASAAHATHLAEIRNRYSAQSERQSLAAFVESAAAAFERA
jgi:hypothetical protein